jgi:hypothetical protein
VTRLLAERPFTPDLVPHRRWCPDCAEWRMCGCWRAQDHITALWLSAVKPLVEIEAYLDLETRLDACQARARNAHAYARWRAQRASRLEVRAQAHAHVTRCLRAYTPKSLPAARQTP